MEKTLAELMGKTHLNSYIFTLLYKDSRHAFPILVQHTTSSRQSVRSALKSALNRACFTFKGPNVQLSYVSCLALAAQLGLPGRHALGLPLPLRV